MVEPESNKTLRNLVEGHMPMILHEATEQANIFVTDANSYCVDTVAR